MPVRFIIGRAGSGKTHHCFEQIVQSLRADPLGAPIWWILPRQATFMAQRELARAGVGPAEAEARFIVEHVSGYDTGEWLEIADAAPPARAERERRLT